MKALLVLVLSVVVAGWAGYGRAQAGTPLSCSQTATPTSFSSAGGATVVTVICTSLTDLTGIWFLDGKPVVSSAFGSGVNPRVGSQSIAIPPNPGHAPLAGPQGHTVNVEVCGDPALGCITTPTTDITVAPIPPAVVFPPAILPNGTVGVPYSAAVSATGGTPPYTFTVTAGALPPGLGLSAAGAITGTPTAAGVASVTIRVVDNAAQSATQVFSISIAPPPLVFPPTALPSATVGAAYTATVSASGGTPPYTFTVTAGALPPGLGLSAAGAITGTPTAAGVASVTIRVVDNAAQSATQAFSISVAPPPLVFPPAALPSATVGAAYTATVSASGGTPPYTFALVAGALPSGLTLSANGTVSGVPSAAGTSIVTVSVGDTAGQSASQNFAITVLPPPLVLSPATLPNPPIGVAYSQTISASGGVPPYTLTLNSGRLPGGLTFNPQTGVISGTRTTPAAASFVIGVIDSTKALGSREYNFPDVAAPPIALTPAVLPDGTVGISYSQKLSASGGVPPYSFAIGSGTLPSNLFLNAQTGTISGTPTAPVVANFVVTATDSIQTTGSKSYTLTVVPPLPVVPPLTLSPADLVLPVAIVGIRYMQTFTATGGTPPYVFSVTGSLPGGFALDPSTGMLTGTFGTQGSFTFTVSVTDSAQRVASRGYTLAGSPPSGSAVLVSGDRQIAAAGSPLRANLVARIVNPAGVPVAGVPVAWTVTRGGGTLVNPSAVSDAQGLVQSGYTTGPLAEENSILLSVPANGSQVAFTIRNQQQVVIAPARLLITPQEEIALNTPNIQMDNIRERLRQLRLKRSASAAEGLRLAIDGISVRPGTMLALASSDKDGKPQNGNAVVPDKTDPFERWGTFVNGDIDVATHSAFDANTGFKLRTKGVTFGVDYRFEGNHVLGAGIGLMNADSNLDGNAGDQNARGYGLSLYGSYVLQENGYVDGILNLGHNRYDGQRLQSSGNNIATNNTNGDQLGMSLGVGYAFNRGALTLTPYGRVDYVNATIKAFTENGGPDDALAIGDQRIRATTILAGGQMSYAVSTSFGVLVPNARVELQHVAQSNARNVTARLAADITSQAEVVVAGRDRNFGTFAAGVSAQLPQNISAFFNFETLFGKDSVRDQHYTFGVSLAF